MALLPPPDIGAAYVDEAKRPSKDFYNWIKSLYDYTRTLTGGGGGGTPGGGVGNVQYNAGAGAFGGYTNAQVTSLLDLFTAAPKGLVQASGGGVSNFLRADGNWSVPPGTGGGARNYVSITDFGGVGDNTTDNSTPLNNALASLAGSGGVIFFPDGKYKFNSRILFSYPATSLFSVTLMGASQDGTILTWPNAAGGIQFTLTAAVQNFQTFHLRDMTLATSIVNGGTAFRVSSVAALSTFGCSVSNVLMVGDTRAGLANNWTIGLEIEQTSAVNIDSLTVYGNVAGTNGTGINLIGGAGSEIVINVQRSNFFGTNIGLNINANVEGVTVEACNFTNGTTGIRTPGGPITGLDQLYIAGCQFDTKGDAIVTNSAFGNLFVIGNLFLAKSGFSAINMPGSNTFVIANNIIGGASSHGVGITVGTTAGSANTISGNTLTLLDTGLSLSATGNNMTVTGNSIVNCTTGVSVAGTKININGNLFQSAPITNTGTNIRITNNIGYNPQGVLGIGVGSSPFTYTAGPTGETVYIRGGTVSEVDFDVNGGGLTTVAFQQTNCTIHLGPNEQLKVTYSSAPSMNAMRH